MSSSTLPTGEISLEDFRRQGHEMIDWIVEYLEHPERYPVLSRSRPGEIREQLPAHAPEMPESLSLIFQDFERLILPGITHWNHPGFFAYFGISGSAPGILAELLAATLNINAMKWLTSPAATELEERVLEWLAAMMGLDSGWTGIMTDTASISSLLAIAAARQAIPGLEVRTQGLTGRSDIPRLRAYVSDQTHSSVEKGAITLGIGQENVIKIPSDADFRMSPAALEQTIEADLQAGFKPFFICGTVGTTSTTSVDPLPALAQIAARNNIWFHVDAAYGGAAAILPEKRAVLAGAEQADSLVINPHKWLFTQVHCSAFYIRKPEILKQAFSLVPAYLRSAEADAEQVRDYMDYGVQLGKRFRALKLWFVIRAYGRRGLEDRIREHIRLAAEFAAWVDQSPDFERLAPTPFSTICFRAHPTAIDDEQTLTALNESLLDAVNASGEVFLSATRLRGMYTLRLAIGNLRSDARHVARAWELLGEALRAQV